MLFIYKSLARAISPDHLANGWTMDCQRCHTTTLWASATVPHDAFPLVGGHGGLDCTRCHTSGTFGTIPADCYACHQSDYEGAPDHIAGSFSQNCEQCHSIAAWTPATYDHTMFPLTGGHAGLDCTQCHTSGTFGTIPSDCYSCHSADYASAADHASLSLSQDCERCHTTSVWMPSTFQHAFPLTGDHDVSCTQCHTTGSVSTFNCLDCHEDDHKKVDGYSYNSQACYTCHPDGRE